MALPGSVLYPLVGRGGFLGGGGGGGWVGVGRRRLECMVYHIYIVFEDRLNAMRKADQYIHSIWLINWVRI